MPAAYTFPYGSLDASALPRFVTEPSDPAVYDSDDLTQQGSPPPQRHGDVGWVMDLLESDGVQAPPDSPRSGRLG